MTAGTSLRTGTWTVVAEKTAATFTVGKLGVFTVHGSIPVTMGSVQVADESVTAVEAALDLDRIDTGIRKRDVDLRKPALLAIDRHPVLTFAADRVEGGPAEWSIHGVLGVRGTSCPLTLAATGPAKNDDGTMRVTATAVLDRLDIGLKAPSFLIGRVITITIDAVLAPPA